jgi:predicted GIY-YIG superfamily endonuclease
MKWHPMHPAPSLGKKQIKGGSRQKKIDLINNINPDWRDLYDEL